MAMHSTYYRRVHYEEKCMFLYGEPFSEPLPASVEVRDVHGCYRLGIEVCRGEETSSYRMVASKGFSLLPPSALGPEKGRNDVCTAGHNYFPCTELSEAKSIFRSHCSSVKNTTRLREKRDGLNLLRAYYVYGVTKAECERSGRYKVRDDSATHSTLFLRKDEAFEDKLYWNRANPNVLYILDSKISEFTWKLAGIVVEASVEVHGERPPDADEHTYRAARILGQLGHLAYPSCCNLLTDFVSSGYLPLTRFNLSQVEELLGHLHEIQAAFRGCDEDVEYASRYSDEIAEVIQLAGKGVELVRRFAQYLDTQQCLLQFREAVDEGERPRVEEYSDVDKELMAEKLDLFSASLSSEYDITFLESMLLEMALLQLPEDFDETGARALAEKLQLQQYVTVRASMNLMTYCFVGKILRDKHIKGKGICISSVLAFEMGPDKASPYQATKVSPVGYDTIAIDLKGGVVKIGTYHAEEMHTFLDRGCSRQCSANTQKEQPCKNRTLRLVNGRPMCWRHYGESTGSPRGAPSKGRSEVPARAGTPFTTPVPSSRTKCAATPRSAPPQRGDDVTSSSERHVSGDVIFSSHGLGCVPDPTPEQSEMSHLGRQMEILSCPFDPSDIVHLSNGVQLISLSASLTLDKSMFAEARDHGAATCEHSFAVTCEAGNALGQPVCVRFPIKTPFQDALEYEQSGVQYVVRKYEHSELDENGEPQGKFEELTDVFLSFYLGSFVEVVVTHFCNFSVTIVDQRKMNLADALLPPSAKKILGGVLSSIGGAFYLSNDTAKVVTFNSSMSSRSEDSPSIRRRARHGFFYTCIK
mmetsp:Transcript_27019/g.40738  ORF Transcript_27019/g.40738 Transcript_27019/m.40738 type:complete len:813 (+) Transcript_27019:901-3339(+)